MRRPSSNSMTSLSVVYGSPIFIDIPNVEPSESLAGLSPFASRTVPDPSIFGWLAGSARSSKIFSGGAAITRSTETWSRFSAIPAGYLRAHGAARRAGPHRLPARAAAGAHLQGRGVPAGHRCHPRDGSRGAPRAGGAGPV